MMRNNRSRDGDVDAGGDGEDVADDPGDTDVPPPLGHKDPATRKMLSRSSSMVASDRTRNHCFLTSCLLTPTGMLSLEAPLQALT